MKKCLHVPIYDAVVWLVVSDEIHATRKSRSMVKLFGEPPPAEVDWAALCDYNGRGIFGIFVGSESLTVDVIAHEVFHLTYRILEWASAGVDKGNHEAGALLHGYLMNLISGILGPLAKR
jgi:hypothetical protein